MRFSAIDRVLQKATVHRRSKYVVCFFLVVLAAVFAGWPAAAPAGEPPFSGQVSVYDATNLRIVLRVAPAHHLYRDQLKLTVVAPENSATVATVSWPAGVMKDEPGMGLMEQYGPGEWVATAPLIRQSGGELVLQAKLRFQGCADAGVCLAPETVVATLTLPAMAAAPLSPQPVPPIALTATNTVASTVAPGFVASGAGAASATLDQQETLAHAMATKSLASTLLSFFGFGLLLALTPCVFPMIPILSGIIVGQGQSVSTWRAFLLSLSYVLAMALTYTVVGVVAGLLGKNIQAALQNPYALSAMAALLVALSLSMFGLYELQLPSSWQTRLGSLSRSQQGGTYLGAAVMGVFSALMVGPCVAPPLAGALIYIGQTGDAVLGGMALFSLSIGMGAPLLLVGTTAGKLLPRAGVWMDRVKAAFGLIMIGVAISMVARVFPPFWIMLAWAVLLFAAAVALDAHEPLPAESGHLVRLGKAVGLVFSTWAVLVLVGAATGADDPMRPLARLNVGATGGGVAVVTGTGSVSGELPFKTVRSLVELDSELAAAKAARRPVLIDVWATWCTACHELDTVTFTDPAVRRELSSFTLIRFDVTDNGDPVTEFYKRFRVVGPPTLLFFAADGQESRAERQIGFVPPATLLGLLARIAH